MTPEALGEIAYCTYRRITEKNFVTLPWDQLPERTRTIWTEQAEQSRQTYEEEHKKNLEGGH